MSTYTRVPYQSQTGYVRFVLILMKCSSSVLRKVMSTHVTRSGHTLGQLLQTHETAIRSKAVGKWNFRVLFPLNGSASDLEHWDLSLLCCVLDIINIPNINNHVEELKNLRNFVCHVKRPSLQEADYNKKTGQLKNSIEELLKFVNDPKFKEDIENEMYEIEANTHPPIHDQMRMMYQWLTVDNDIRETLQVMRQESRDHHQVTQESVETLRTEQREGFDNQQERMNQLTTEISQLHETIRRLESTIIGPPPGASVEIIQHNLTDEQRQDLSRRLVRYFGEIVLKRGVVDDLANDQRDQLHAAVEEAYAKLHTRGNDISKAEDGSVRLKVECQEYGVLIDFLEDCIVGNITQCFRPLEDAIRSMEGFENYTHDVVILKDDYLACIREISEKMETCKAVKDNRLESEKQKLEEIEERRVIEERREGHEIIERGRTGDYDNTCGTTDIAAGRAEKDIKRIHRSTSYLFDRMSDHITGADLVVALDVGTTYSGYAWQWRSDFERNKGNVEFNTYWGPGAPQLHKTQTSLLVKTRPGKDFSDEVYIGFQAEQRFSKIHLSDKSENEKDSYHLFRNFKLQLYKMGSGPQESIQTEDTMGQHFPLMNVMSLFIKSLRDHFIQNRARKPQLDKILWVLTVPAIWSERAKMFMREAAEKSGIDKKHILLALEPEASTVACMNLPEQERTNMDNFSTPGHHFLTVDIGGGTVDLSAVRVSADGRLEELVEESGACVGGNNVNEWLVAALHESFKGNAWQSLMTRTRPHEVMKMEQMIETFKLQDNLEDEFWDLEIPMAVKKAIENNELRLKESSANITLGDEKIRVRRSFVRSGLFKRSCESIYNVISKVLKGCPAIKTVILVGGFAESLVVQDDLTHLIKNDFPVINVCVPTSPFKAVLTGAVLYGQDTSIYKSRISRATFGIATNVEFDWQNHDPRKKWKRTLDGKYMCKDVIDVCVWKGEEIHLGEKLPSKTFRPNNDTQKRLSLPLYESSSTKQSVIYTTDANSKKVGEIIVDLADDNIPESQEVEVQITCGGTQLSVKAMNRSTRQKYQADIIFDN